MLQFLKKLGCLGLLALSLQSAHGFALYGPLESWQTLVLGYDRIAEIDYPQDTWTIHEANFAFAPKNRNEWYRWSVPTLYYTYDPSFLTYFGSNGVQAVDAAFNIMNAVTNVDRYSADLREFQTQEIRVNYTAAALHLFDIKSAAFEMLLTRMGLADPERWAFCIKERVLPPGLQCPYYDFTIVQRNFDPLSLDYSRYINGSMFSYIMRGACPPAYERFDTVEYLLDPTETYNSAVAASKIVTPNIRYFGHYHTWLTRDDIGGLKYIYSTNRLALELSPPDTVQFVTNTAPTLLVTSNLSILAAQAYTNSAAVLSGLFPGLAIIDSTNWFTNVFTTNVTAYFTNFPWDPAFQPTRIAYSTNVTVSSISVYDHTYGNLMQVKWTPDGYKMIPLYKLPPRSPAWVSIETSIVGVTNNPWLPSAGTFVYSNTLLSTFLTNDVVGDYVLPPTNFCAADIVYAQLTNVVSFTNPLYTATNLVASTNASGLTNSGTLLAFSQNLIQYYTNRAFVIHPVTCETNTAGLRQGLGKISFVRHDYDSLLGRFFYPITNFFKMVAYTNNGPVVQQFQRVVTRPDIVIASRDLLNAIPDVPVVDSTAASAPLFNGTNGIPGLAGPGTLEGPMTLTFNQSGPVRLNSGIVFGDEVSSILWFTWASFDGSTNAPTLFGGGTIQDLLNQIAIVVAPTTLPVGVQGRPYNVTLSVNGGQAPYNWAMSPISPPLPQGMSFQGNAGNTATATLTGTPVAAGTHQFQIRVTDAGGRFVDMNYSLVVRAP